MNNHLLSKEDLTAILNERFKTEKITDINWELTSTSKTIEGFMGEYFLLKLTCKIQNKNHTETFFIKAKPTKNELQQKTLNSVNYYKKEIFLYNHLFKEYERMGYDTSFAPKCYHCTTNETIILEDLKEKGYQPVTNFVSFDLEHCKQVLISLAYFHASSLAYEETKSKEKERIYRLNEDYPTFFIEEFFIDDVEAPSFINFNCSIESFVELSKLLLESDEWKKEFEEKLRRYKYYETFDTKFGSRKTCCHGDLWINNLLFKYEDGVPKHCCLIDFQLQRYGHPIFDVLLVLYTNTLKDMREQHYDYLLNFYYDKFEEILSGYGYEAKNLLSKEECFKPIEILKSVAVLQAVSDRSVTMLPAEVVDSTISEYDYQNILFTKERTIVVKKAFETNEEYRRVISDDLYELFNVVCKIET